jgi:hypothetical protein
MIGTTLAAYLFIYAVLLAVYIGTLFHLANKAASGHTGQSEVTGPQPMLPPETPEAVQ